MRIQWSVADSLTGKLVGRLRAVSEWEWSDPLTGQAEATLSLPLPTEPEAVERLASLLQPHIRQVVARDEQGRWWWGGPILSDPEREGQMLKVPVSDWRAWFYAATIRPNSDGTRRDYIRRKANAVDQCQAIADIATIALDTSGAPRVVVDDPPTSGILRDVSARMFKVAGEAMDSVAQRERGSDWWTYLDSDSDDETSVVAHVAVGYPERSLATMPLVLRYQLGQVGNVLAYTWPRGTPTPSRVYGVDSTPAPNETWEVAEDPGLTDPDVPRLAWDEVYQVPEGVSSEDAIFEHALSRLEAHTSAIGVAELVLDPAATDLGGWGPGDRARLIVQDGWRDVDLPECRILSRTLTGRGQHVTEVRLSLDLSAHARDIAEPEEEVTGGEA